jgi:hypothetical protein
MRYLLGPVEGDTATLRGYLPTIYFLRGRHIAFHRAGARADRMAASIMVSRRPAAAP